MHSFRDRDIRIVLAASGLSALGDLVAVIGLTVRVHDATGSGLAVAALVLCGILPMTVLSPVTGWLVDRFETVRVLVLTACAQAGIALALAFAESFPALLALALGLGAGVAVSRPAMFALLPRLAGKDRLAELNAWYQAAYFTGAAAGPVAGGFLVAAGGVRLALLVDAATFVVFAVACAALRVRRNPAAARGPESAGAGAPQESSPQSAGGGTTEDPGGRGGFGRGFAALAADRVLLLAVGLFGASILFVASANVAEVFLVKDVLGGGDVGYGVLNAAWTAGMVAGTTLIARRLRTERLMPALLGGCAVTGAAVLAAGGAPVLAVAVAAYLVGGTANGVQNVALRTLIQHRAPEWLHGRVYAAYAGIAATADIGSTGLGGTVVTAAGGRAAMILLGAGALAAAGIGALGHRRLSARPPGVAVEPDAAGSLPIDRPVPPTPG